MIRTDGSQLVLCQSGYLIDKISIVMKICRTGFERMLTGISITSLFITAFRITLRSDVKLLCINVCI